VLEQKGVKFWQTVLNKSLVDKFGAGSQKIGTLASGGHLLLATKMADEIGA
jgi:hypothetical protein